ncbi:N-acetylmuramic acid 6-phosphate etherase [Roseibium denhamense]|uniref:N-acetylmuramic acid 6-phosphate etherase n=1 Tax=Roseibium denhamense TaxID=76305 RepID=A0ABY1NH62_9HYPH|nr:N-acetylmuramic acid 6-phosphate etherase [Roseibium denhamense]MTI06452.1 N-acetylmuramic acid 6-phosphate etherase [Roseibium denhamense]SMP09270.1 N-acetylmuramic acid 6-phosphate etherase [Roseibium denhamense]
MAVSDLPETEKLHEDALGIDVRPALDVAGGLLAGQQEAVRAVAGALPQLVAASEAMVHAIRGGGRLVYAAAGSSALMALADAAELPGTYGLDLSQVRLFMAGGVPVNGSMPGGTEDDHSAGEQDAGAVTPSDLVIALTASGTTPYPMAFAKKARSIGAKTICIANNPDVPIFEFADVAIALPTPPEVVAGSTRMGAGTAQKAALNIMSTLMGIGLGHVHDGMMVNLIADNAKLRERAAGIVCRIAGVDRAQAQRSLEKSNWAVKPAVLLASGATSLDQAENLLARTNGQLRAALQHI